jgi:hypothetical protein
MTVGSDFVHPQGYLNVDRRLRDRSNAWRTERY